MCNCYHTVLLFIEVMLFSLQIGHAFHKSQSSFITISKSYHNYLLTRTWTNADSSQISVVRTNQDILFEMESALKEGGLKALSIQKSVTRKNKSASYDLVTEGDITSQAVITNRFSNIFPAVPYVPEENDAEACAKGIELVSIDQAQNKILAETYLTIDPIDGTSNYASGSPDWGPMACLIKDNMPSAAVLHMPSKDVTFLASKGKGCYRNGHKINLKQNLRLCDVIVGAEIHPLIEEARLHKVMRLMTGKYALGIRNTSSSIGNFVDILEGNTGAFVHMQGASIWDLAAGVLAVEEAGGYCCDLHGKPLQWNQLKMEAICANDKKMALEIVDILGMDK
mmetsp:Transcript_25562/g.33435  ORF Transcript_25562/g.33435 Transcript_25562/m.33435 type:complete len:339 (+) Transcript_25562:42-1058(+)